MECFMGIDIGSISTKGVIIDSNNNIIAKEYIWTEGNPVNSVKKLVVLSTGFSSTRFIATVNVLINPFNSSIEYIVSL